MNTGTVIGNSPSDNYSMTGRAGGVHGTKVLDEAGFTPRVGQSGMEQDFPTVLSMECNLKLTNSLFLDTSI